MIYILGCLVGAAIVALALVSQMRKRAARDRRARRAERQRKRVFEWELLERLSGAQKRRRLTDQRRDRDQRL